MIRIIGGEARGRRIRTPSGDGTRPTSDRVREALFSSLEAELGTLAGRRFLDLFAGSGGVGLEAKSRGAESVTLVERSARAAAVIRQNASALRFDVEVIVSPVSKLGDRGSVGRPPFDVVFADPPYDHPSDRLAEELAALAVHGWLADGASVVVERDRRSTWAWRPPLAGVRSRVYGETMLWYGRPQGPAAEEA
jgi:16S rRNA (guanine966-N2)-methyltransferase